MNSQMVVDFCFRVKDLTLVDTYIISRSCTVSFWGSRYSVLVRRTCDVDFFLMFVCHHRAQDANAPIACV